MTTNLEQANLTHLQGKKLLWVMSGAIGSAFAPYWANWIELSNLDIDLRVVLTPAAQRFVSNESLNALVKREIEIDSWADNSGSAFHVELAQWADVIIIHPCTFDFLARFASGRGDSPVMLALQSTEALIMFCPALPPGMVNSVAFKNHVQHIKDRENTLLAWPTQGISTQTREFDAAPAANFLECLLTLSKALTSKGINNE